jgi:hypothetical protein
MKQITKYLCSKCGEEFRRKSFCERHEATCKAQGCDMCKHSIPLENGWFRCKRYDGCKFELKEKSK